MIVSLADKHTEPDGALRTLEQDNFSELLGLYCVKNIGQAYLASGVELEARILPFKAGHGFTAGDRIGIYEGKRYYQGLVTNVATNDITVDSPVDFAFTANAVVYRASDSLAVDGSSVTQVFSIKPPIGVKWDILGIGFHITDNAAMDDALFGGITALTNGIVVRRINNEQKVIFNAKSNGDFYARCDVVEYSSKAPSGYYGLNIKRNFRTRNGVSIRLDGTTGDEYQVLVQDNLTALASFKATIYGHVVS